MLDALRARFAQLSSLALLAASMTFLPACVATVRARPVRAVVVAPAPPPPRAVVVVGPRHPHRHHHHHGASVRVRVHP